MKLKRDRFEGAVGICRKCLNNTSVLNPCCGSDVLYCGIIFKREDFESKED